jgi:hypothetical protein
MILTFSRTLYRNDDSPIQMKDLEAKLNREQIKVSSIEDGRIEFEGNSVFTQMTFGLFYFVDYGSFEVLESPDHLQLRYKLVSFRSWFFSGIGGLLSYLQIESVAYSLLVLAIFQLVFVFSTWVQQHFFFKRLCSVIKLNNGNDIV